MGQQQTLGILWDKTWNNILNNYNNNAKNQFILMKKILAFSLLSLIMMISLSSCGETETGFAIVIDTESYENATNEIDAYVDVLEREGLRTHLLVKDYNHPDELKSELLELYQSDTPIEGAVFIGDIPIVYTMDAQHMTSAFKMDQEYYGMEMANVPTDRFYDDFDLQWDYIRVDSNKASVHYYSLSPDSPQQIHPDIYSGRIKMPEVENKYELLRKYMVKVVEEHQAENVLDEFFFFAGSGYNSESMIARLDEQVVLDQQLPGNPNITFLDHTMQVHIKFPYMTELQREDLDIGIMHHHGGEDTEYLSGWPKSDNYLVQMELVQRYLRARIRRAENKGKDEINKVKKDYKEKYGIPDSWFDGAFDPETREKDSIWDADQDLVVEDFDIYNYKPNIRFGIFDACYNGSFYVDEYLTGSYIFSEGKTVAAQGNTVNSLQDKWPQEMIGLLSLGMRVGEWNRMVCYLETHIIGDPTFRFKTVDPSLDVQKMAVTQAKNNKLWLGLLESQYPDVQALALRKLFDNGYPGISDLLLDTYKTSNYGSVRTECLKLSSQINDTNFLELMKLALLDEYELVQRFAMNMSGDIGSEELIPLLVEIGFMNIPKRVEFSFINNMQFFDSEKLVAEFEKQYDVLTYLAKKEEAYPIIKGAYEDANRRYRDVIEVLTDPESSDRSLYNNIRNLRNYNYHMGVPVFLQFLEESDNQEHRQMMIEALGWFVLSVEKQQIIDFIEKISQDEAEPEEIRNEARKTLKRLG